MQRLVVRLATTGTVDRQVQALLKQRLPLHRLVGLATARGGAALDMTVCLAPLAMEVALALVAELTRIEGVQGVELKE